MHTSDPRIRRRAVATYSLVSLLGSYQPLTGPILTGSATSVRNCLTLHIVRIVYLSLYNLDLTNPEPSKRGHALLVAASLCLSSRTLSGRPIFI